MRGGGRLEERATRLPARRGGPRWMVLSRMFCPPLPLPQLAPARPLPARLPAAPLLPARPSPPSAAAGSAPGGEDKKFLGASVDTLKKVALLGFMFFCILFNYTILRDTKVRERGREGLGTRISGQRGFT